MPNIYRFLKEAKGYAEPDWLARVVAEADDPTPVIVGAALDARRPCPIADQTLGLFVEIMAAEAGNMALRLLATSGVYLGGGIPPRILDALRTPAFLEAVHSKGRLSYVVKRMPVHVVLNSDAALLGAASFGLSALVGDR